MFKILSRGVKFNRYRATAQDVLKSVSALMTEHNVTLSNFPIIAFVGPQSSGKSSVFEAICGKSLVPKGMKMSTMKPFYVTTIRSQNELYKVGNKEFQNIVDAMSEIDSQNLNPGIQSINITIQSPEVYNSYFVDLPGLFHTKGDTEHNDQDDVKKIKQMTIKELKNRNNIPVIVHAGPADPGTNKAIEYAKKFERIPHCLGVLTKLDMLKEHNTEHVEELLNWQKYKVGYGWHGLVLRSDSDNKKGVSIEQKIVEETDFFGKRSEFPKNNVGTLSLRQKISEIQFEKIKEQVPYLIAEVDKILADMNKSNSLLTELLNNNTSQIASDLEYMIEKTVGSSLERARFEKNLKSEIAKIIGKYFENDLSKNIVDENKLSNDMVDRGIHSFLSHNVLTSEKIQNDQFKPLFSYGVISPVQIDNKILDQIVSNEYLFNASVTLIKPELNDPLGEKRIEWYTSIQNYFSKLLKDDYLYKEVCNVTQKLLLEYLSKNDSDSKFTKYILGEASRTVFQNEAIKYSVAAMLNIEKRPSVSLTDISRHFINMHPTHFEYKGGLLETYYETKNKIKLEIYSSEWNKAYLSAVIEKVTENSYRNIAVNVLDHMVKTLLEIAFGLTNKEITMKEQKKVSDKISKLQGIRSIMVEYADKDQKIDDKKKNQE